MNERERAAAPGSLLSAWAPLEVPLFRALWIGALVSFVGTFMHEVGEGWLMTSLTPSPALVALVPAAVSLPIFLFSLPAGALADAVDRRKLLLVAQTWMMLMAALLGILTYAHQVTPGLLLLLAFLLGTGAAVTIPPWQASIAEWVPRDMLPAAIALGSIAFNVARGLGPMLGGAVMGAWGPGAVFLVNAASFTGVIATIWYWKRPRAESTAPSERMLGSIRSGIRYVRHSPPLRAVMVRTALFSVCASALWALAPTLARHVLSLPAQGYGSLVSAMGAGAIAGAVLMPRVRARFSVDSLVVLSTVVFAVAFAVFALVRSVAVIALAMAAAGGAWLTMMASLNLAVQLSAPTWVRARALSIYVLVFHGTFAAGSALWGVLAARSNLALSFAVAAAGLLLGLVSAQRWRIADAGHADLTPSGSWPVPESARDLAPGDGPVLVTLEYRIEPARADEFADAMEEVRLMRRREGATSWGLFRDPADPARFVEAFFVDSWAEHVRQHDRVTVADGMIIDRARSYDVGPNGPAVSHLVAYTGARAGDGSKPRSEQGIVSSDD